MLRQLAHKPFKRNIYEQAKLTELIRFGFNLGFIGSKYYEYWAVMKK